MLQVVFRRRIVASLLLQWVVSGLFLAILWQVIFQKFLNHHSGNRLIAIEGAKYDWGLNFHFTLLGLFILTTVLAVSSVLLFRPKIIFFLHCVGWATVLGWFALVFLD